MLRQFAFKHVNKIPIKSDSVRFLATTSGGDKTGSSSSGDISAASNASHFRFSSMIHPKLKVFGLHARYANALYSNASKMGKLSEVEKELQSMDELISSNGNFKAYLSNPIIPRHKKTEALNAFMSEGKFSEPVRGFFRVLAENGRLKETQNIITLFKEIMSTHRGEVKAQVVSADPLTSQQLELVKSALKKHVKKDESLVLQTTVNPQILGGLQVHIGSMFIDLSISSKISKLDKLLSTPVEL